MDLAVYDPYEQLPDRPSSRSELGMFKTVTALARDERLTIRQLWRRLAGSYGKLTLVGSVDRVVETLGHWYREGGCDGFIIQPSVLPHDVRSEEHTSELPSLMRCSYAVFFLTKNK